MTTPGVFKVVDGLLVVEFFLLDDLVFLGIHRVKQQTQRAVLLAQEVEGIKCSNYLIMVDESVLARDGELIFFHYIHVESHNNIMMFSGYFMINTRSVLANIVNTATGV